MKERTRDALIRDIPLSWFAEIKRATERYGVTQGELLKAILRSGLDREKGK